MKTKETKEEVILVFKYRNIRYYSGGSWIAKLDKKSNKIIDIVIEDKLLGNGEKHFKMNLNDPSIYRFVEGNILFDGTVKQFIKKHPETLLENQQKESKENSIKYILNLMDVFHVSIKELIRGLTENEHRRKN